MEKFNEAIKSTPNAQQWWDHPLTRAMLEDFKQDSINCNQEIVNNIDKTDKFGKNCRTAGKLDMAKYYYETIVGFFQNT